eukprot:5256191-Pyramimonas_sp.AAC.1
MHTFAELLCVAARGPRFASEGLHTSNTKERRIWVAGRGRWVHTYRCRVLSERLAPAALQDNTCLMALWGRVRGWTGQGLGKVAQRPLERSRHASGAFPLPHTTRHAMSYPPTSDRPHPDACAAPSYAPCSTVLHI